MISIHVFTLSWQNIEKSLNQACLLKTSHYWAKVDVCGGVFVCFAPQVSQVFHVSLLAGISFVKVLSPAWGIIVWISRHMRRCRVMLFDPQKVCRQIIICVAL